MDATLLQRVLTIVEGHLESRSSQVEFELAYQARTACDRIRFAIKTIEAYGANCLQVREANLQLLDALDRLESADHHFQERFRPVTPPSCDARIAARTNGDISVEKHH